MSTEVTLILAHALDVTFIDVSVPWGICYTKIDAVFVAFMALSQTEMLKSQEEIMLMFTATVSLGSK